ncbi:MAG: hypothetical protein ABIQ56_01610, partial [Chitinophagaceae bacterium]
MKFRKLVSSLIPKPLRTLKYKLTLKGELIRHILKDYGWSKALETGKCIDKNGNPIPWFSYPAIDFLSQLNIFDKEVFEYGCGFST